MKSRKTRMLVALWFVAISGFSLVAISFADELKAIKLDVNNAIQTIPEIFFKSSLASDNSVELKNLAWTKLINIIMNNNSFVIKRSKDSSSAKGSLSTVLWWTQNNVDNGNYSTIIAWSGNQVNSSSHATIGWWNANRVSGSHWTVAGWESNEAKKHSTVVWGKNNVAGGEYSVALWNDNVAGGKNSVAMWSGATVNGNNSFLWSDSDKTLNASNVFAVNGENGMVVNANKAHRFAKLTIWWSLSISDGSADVQCSAWVLKVVNRTDVTSQVCFCSCDGTKWHSLFGGWQCNSVCDSTFPEPMCDPDSAKKIYGEDDIITYSGGCLEWEVVQWVGAFLIDNMNVLHWTCQTKDGAHIPCTGTIKQKITIPWWRGTDPVGEYECTGDPQNAKFLDWTDTDLTDNTGPTLYNTKAEAQAASTKCRWYCEDGFYLDWKFCLKKRSCNGCPSGTVEDGGKCESYSKWSVTSPETCPAKITSTCNNGSWDNQPWEYSTCTQNYRSCESTACGTKENWQSCTSYNRCSSTKITSTCNDGTWSRTPWDYSSSMMGCRTCTSTVCGTKLHSQSCTSYNRCSSTKITSTCNDGTWNPTPWNYSSANQGCNGCEASGWCPAKTNGQTCISYDTCSSTSKTSTCVDWVWSPTPYGYSSANQGCNGCSATTYTYWSCSYSIPALTNWWSQTVNTSTNGYNWSVKVSCSNWSLSYSNKSCSEAIPSWCSATTYTYGNCSYSIPALSHWWSQAVNTSTNGYNWSVKASCSNWSLSYSDKSCSAVTPSWCSATTYTYGNCSYSIPALANWWSQTVDTSTDGYNWSVKATCSNWSLSYSNKSCSEVTPSWCSATTYTYWSCSYSIPALSHWWSQTVNTSTDGYNWSVKVSCSNWSLSYSNKSCTAKSCDATTYTYGNCSYSIPALSDWWSQIVSTSTNGYNWSVKASCSKWSLSYSDESCVIVNVPWTKCQATTYTYWSCSYSIPEMGNWVFKLVDTSTPWYNWSVKATCNNWSLSYSNKSCAAKSCDATTYTYWTCSYSIPALSDWWSQTVSTSTDGYNWSVKATCSKWTLSYSSNSCAAKSCDATTYTYWSCSYSIPALSHWWSQTVSTSTDGYNWSVKASCSKWSLSYSSQSCTAKWCSSTSHSKWSCTFTIPELSNGGSTTVTYTTSPYYGSTTAKCTNGSLTYSSESCITVCQNSSAENLAWCNGSFSPTSYTSEATRWKSYDYTCKYWTLSYSCSASCTEGTYWMGDGKYCSVPTSICWTAKNGCINGWSYVNNSEGSTSTTYTWKCKRWAYKEDCSIAKESCPSGYVPGEELRSADDCWTSWRYGWSLQKNGTANGDDCVKCVALSCPQWTSITCNGQKSQDYAGDNPCYDCVVDPNVCTETYNFTPSRCSSFDCSYREWATANAMCESSAGNGWSCAFEYEARTYGWLYPECVCTKEVTCKSCTWCPSGTVAHGWTCTSYSSSSSSTCPVITSKCDNWSWNKTPGNYSSCTKTSWWGGGWWGCFLAWTPVITSEWPKNIEDIEIGDMVLSYNTLTLQNEYNKVTEKYVHEDNNDELYELTIDGKILEVTRVHVFFVANDDNNDYQCNMSFKLRHAQSLKVWDRLMMSDGKYVTIENITHRHNYWTVYNLEVENVHNYFVAEWYLVHNSLEQKQLVANDDEGTCGYHSNAFRNENWALCWRYDSCTGEFSTAGC